MSKMTFVTATAPVNIAVVKYWGKRDEARILPINDSVSVTLSDAQMHAKTTVCASPDLDADRIWLNGKEESVDNPRLANCLRDGRKGVSWKWILGTLYSIETKLKIATATVNPLQKPSQGGEETQDGGGGGGGGGRREGNFELQGAHLLREQLPDCGWSGVVGRWLRLPHVRTVEGRNKLQPISGNIFQNLPFDNFINRKRLQMSDGSNHGRPTKKVERRTAAGFTE